MLSFPLVEVGLPVNAVSRDVAVKINEAFQEDEYAAWNYPLTSMHDSQDLITVCFFSRLTEFELKWLGGRKGEEHIEAEVEVTNAPRM